MRARVVSALLLAASCLFPLRAGAQQEVEVAAKAFAEGQQAQVRGDFVRAAELFEIADQAVPSPAAVRSAIRMRGAAGQEVRAATLALQAIQRYAEDGETRAVAETAIGRFGPRLTRIRLSCTEPCTATLDGALVGAGSFASLEFFVTPGAHVVKASWPGRPAITESLESSAGQSLEILLSAPPALKPAPAPAPARPAPAAVPPPRALALAEPLEPVSTPRRDSGGLSPAVFWTGAALSAVGGGLVYWSGRDTLDERDEYERNPTREAYDRGVKLERRTNLLIAGTAVLAVATLSIGAFATDWGSSSNAGGTGRGARGRAAALDTVRVNVGPAQAAISWSGALP
jgi:hypothetical protein